MLHWLAKPFLIPIIIVYLLIINLIAFLQMKDDKKRAQKKEWRIPEKRLFLPVILGGSIGGLLGIYVIRHKTKHWYFPAGFWTCLVIHIILLVLWILL